LVDRFFLAYFIKIKLLTSQEVFNNNKTITS